MVDRRPHRAHTARRLRWCAPAGVVAAVLIVQTASAGEMSIGSASGQAADIALVSSGPEINLSGSTTTLQLGPGGGQQDLPGTLNVTAGDSSIVAAGTDVSVRRGVTEVEAAAAVEGLTVTLLGHTVASATVLGATVTCSANGPAQAQATAAQLVLGESDPVDLDSNQDASGSISVTGPDGTTYAVGLAARTETVSSNDSTSAFGIKLAVSINDNPIGGANLAFATCIPPSGGLGEEAPGPDGGLADSGTDIAVIAALLGFVLVTGGGSALLWARSRRR